MAFKIVLPGGLVQVPSLRGVLSAASAENALLAITAAGTTNVPANTTKPFLFCHQLVTVAAGSYTHNLTLAQANAIKGSLFILSFEIAAGTDDTLSIPIFNHATGGSPIEQLYGRAEASYYFFVARNIAGTDWEKLFGAYL